MSYPQAFFILLVLFMEDSLTFLFKLPEILRVDIAERHEKENSPRYQSKHYHADIICGRVFVLIMEPEKKSKKSKPAAKEDHDQDDNGKFRSDSVPANNSEKKELQEVSANTL